MRVALWDSALCLSKLLMRSHWVTLGLFCALGCSGGEAVPTDPQATVAGSVTNDGVNVTADSNIVFYCTEKNATAAGLIDSLGKFSLTPGMKSIGIPAGRYQVMIRPPEPPAPEVGTKEYEDFMAGKVQKPEPPKDIPPEFGAFDTSGISVEVKVGPNNFDFDLAKLAKGASSKPITDAK